MKKFSTLAFILLALSTTSCKKQTVKETSLEGEVAVKSAMTAGPWVFRNEVVVYSPDNVDHGPSEACKTDDTWTFDLAGSANVTWGTNDCSPFTVPSGSYGSWQLLSDGTILKVSYTRDIPGPFQAGQDAYWNVDFMSAKKMVLKRKVQEYGKSYTLYDTYTRN
ncbi:MAG: hypothetical protein K0Q66_1143 [Chitinophagaceae bacterium]|jgi:hypothetical protein|nr:hypothetical protein [Chitinophagaceae bacterium]